MNYHYPKKQHKVALNRNRGTVTEGYNIYYKQLCSRPQLVNVGSCTAVYLRDLSDHYSFKISEQLRKQKYRGGMRLQLNMNQQGS